MTILVTVPYFGCPDLVERCVRSILDQTYRDIVVLVIGDGEEPPLSIRDDRLVVHTLPVNRGPYFAQQVALTASPYEWYAPVGADDYLDPDHLERLVAVGGDAVATGAVWFHDLVGNVNVHRAKYEVGLFATERLRSLGGHNPAERMGQDTLLLRLLALTGELGMTHHPTYHRVKREGSLMTSPWTGKGTPARNDMRRRNREILAVCQRLMSADLIREYRQGLVPFHLTAEVRDQAKRIDLASAVAA